MDDLISRQSTIDTIHKTICGFFDVAEDDSEEPISEKDKLLLEVNKAICNGIKELPSVQPQRWIPVTERLPEHSGFYIVTAIVTDDGGKLVGLRWFSQEHGWKFGKNPLAWMPLPEPYKEKKNETD